jgi:6-pyruvoyltetrahydropterin/6-carboxytetrahydropterin synthase
MYEVGTTRSVRALHVMPGMPGPEGELHAHEYRIEVVVRRPNLDERGMVCDLDVLDAALRDAAAQVEGKDLELIRPADADAVTVEVFARWLHARIGGTVDGNGGEVLGVRVWESADAFGGYQAPVSPISAAASPSPISAPVSPSREVPRTPPGSAERTLPT